MRPSPLTLGLETATTPGSLALVADDEVLAEYRFGEAERMAEQITYRLRELVQSIGSKIGDIGMVGLTIGPGSFTGLRVGVTLAKTLGYALGCRLVPVSTHLAIAAGVVRKSNASEETEPAKATVESTEATLEPIRKPPSAIEKRQQVQHAFLSPVGLSDRFLVTVVDAFRNGLHVAEYSLPTAGLPWLVDEPHLVSCQDLIQVLRTGKRLCGPGIRRILDQIPEDCKVEPEANWLPSAVSVARLAQHFVHCEPVVDAWELLPQYTNTSAAEQVRTARSTAC